MLQASRWRTSVNSHESARTVIKLFRIGSSQQFLYVGGYVTHGPVHGNADRGAQVFGTLSFEGPNIVICLLTCCEHLDEE